MELREKVIHEAPEGTPADPIKVHVNAEFRILGEKHERRGIYVCGVGAFQRMKASNSYVGSFMATT